MKTTIGKFNPETRQVSVLFTHQGVKHRRPVNACLTEDGGYDAASTKVRVAEVALGVQRKMELGQFGNEPTTPDPIPEPQPAPDPVPEPAPEREPEPSPEPEPEPTPEA